MPYNTRLRSGNEPVDHTCPTIDAVIEDVKYLISGEDDVPEDLIDTIIENIEKIRDANHQLREWGCERDEEATKNSNIIDDLNSEIEELKERVVELDGTVCDLETEVDSLNEEIQELQENS